MTTIVEKKVISDVLKWEVGEGYLFCREKHVVLDGEVLAIGTVCETATGKKIQATTAGNADSICLENDIAPVGADGSAVFLVRGPCIINEDQLDYNSLTKATVDAALAAFGILVRSEPVKSSQL